MYNLKINEQIAFLRKQKGLTQEALADAIGVTNQSVSKWESGQCCPDITLLPELAKIFEVSIDELLGYKSENTSSDIILKIREQINNETDAEAFEDTLRIANALHASVFTKYHTKSTALSESSELEWNTDTAIENAKKAKWHYSCINLPGITTVMRNGVVLYSNNKNLLNSFKLYHIRDTLKMLGEIKNLKLLLGIYELTVQDEESYVSASLISERSGLSERTVADILENDLYPYIVRKSTPERTLYRINGMYMHFIPVILLLEQH